MVHNIGMASLDDVQVPNLMQSTNDPPQYCESPVKLSPSLELSTLCRICLQESITDFIDINNSDIVDKLNLCTGIIIKQDLPLPQRLCPFCLNELLAANKFRTKCLLSDSLLRDYSKKLIAVNKEHRKTSNQSSDNVKNEPADDDDAENELDTSTADNPQKESDEFKHKTVKSECGQKRHTGRVSGRGAGRRYHCESCEYSTPHSQSLVYHRRRHTGERPHRCQCGAAFTQPAALAAHARTHVPRSFHTCPVCGKQFKFAESFRRHQLVHADSQFSCDTCGKSLKTKTSLASHMNRHMGLRNFSCEHCGMTFVTRAELSNHKRKHDTSLQNKFQCHLCTYKTYTKKGLVCHLKRHSDERPFKCGVCPYDAHSRHQLATHTRTHTRERRYACGRCGRRFLHSSSLNKHARRVHNDPSVWNDTVDRRVVQLLT